jgi:hypothetical protein
VFIMIIQVVIRGSNKCLLGLFRWLLGVLQVVIKIIKVVIRAITRDYWSIPKVAIRVIQGSY